MANREKHVAKQFRQIISHALAFELRDPVLSCVTVTDLGVSTDLQYVDVRVTLGGEDEKPVMAALVKATGAIRKILAKSVSMKRVPELRFHLDRTAEAHSKIDEILQGLVIPPEEPQEDDEA